VTGPLESLHKCRESGEPFVLLSRDEVFDLSEEGFADERSRRDTASDAGKMLVVAEDAVLGYEAGYVIRVGDLLDEVSAAFDALEEPPSRFDNRPMYPVCSECLDHLAGALPRLVPKGAPRFERILHAAALVRIEVATVVFHRFGIADCEIAEDAPPIVPPKKRGLLVARLGNLLPFDEFSAYARANHDNCHRRLFP